MMGDILLNLGLLSVAGIVLFTIIVVVVFRTGFVWRTRDKNGLMKKKQSLSGYAAMLLLPAGIILLQIALNYSSFGPSMMNSFADVFLLDYLLYVILFVYDTLVIDYALLSRWRPRILKLPPALNSKSMRKHILLSIPIGLVIGLAITFFGVMISFCAI